MTGVQTCALPISSQLDEDAAEEYLKNIRANEESYLKWKDGWEFGFLQMGAGSRIDPSKTIQHHNRQILINVLAQFMDLGGQGGGGSFALSKDQSALFLLSLQYVANFVASTINQYAIKRLIEINAEPQVAYPELRVTKIGQTEYTNLTTSIERMVRVGLITPDEDLEIFLRDEMGLTELPEGLREEQEKMKQEQADKQFSLQKEALKKIKQEKVKGSSDVPMKPVIKLKDKVDNAINKLQHIIGAD